MKFDKLINGEIKISCEVGVGVGVGGVGEESAKITKKNKRPPFILILRVRASYAS